MIVSEQADRLDEIIEYYGEENQLKKAAEELEELRVALGVDTTDHIAEEMADVLVMIAQLMMIYGIEEDELMDIFRYKITRTHIRMRMEENDDKSGQMVSGKLL